MHGARKADCPNCGGPIELKLASAAALVCPWCRFSVVRTDRDLRAIGRVADLVPTAPEMTVGDFGTVRGVGFRVGGRTQLDHGRGPWDEWYVELDDGRWGWLAKAQGGWYLSFPVEGFAPEALPRWDQLAPGATGTLPGGGATTYTVAERGASTLVSAEGELPFPLVPNASGHYVDFAGPEGAFATIDFGDAAEAPKVFIGRELAPGELAWKEGAAGPRPEQKVDVARLRCPTCGGPLPIFVPDKTERAVCPSCNAAFDVRNGALAFLHQLQQPAIRPLIPLGTEGDLRGERVLVIGFMQRFCVVEGVTYAWHEYLLHAEHGYRWLLEDNGHFTYVHTASAGDVGYTPHSMTATYRGRKHKLFSRVGATVQFVIGEFYWKVTVGEQTGAADFIAPPFILSEERSADEVVWSAGEYIEPKELWRALKLPGSPPPRVGAGVAQPNPINFKWTALSAAVLMLALVAIGLTFELALPTHVVVEGPLQVPLAPAASAVAGLAAPAAAPETAVYTPEFVVGSGPTTLEVQVNSTVDNQWLGVDCALIDQATGDVREFMVETGYYHGVTDGESWTEGDRATTAWVDRVATGRYVLRLDPQWESYWGPGVGLGGATAPAASIRVTEGRRSAIAWLCALILIVVPLIVSFVRMRAFEKRRWENSNLAMG